MWLKPTYVVEHVVDIDLVALWEQGVRGFIFDLDNTIMAPNTGVLDDKVAGWLKRIDKMGFRSIVVSNNPRAMYTREAEKVVNMPVIGNAGKPRRKQLYRAVEILGMDPHEVAIVGDRPLTDIWGGHRLGSKTILVESLSKHKENALIRFLRKLEWLAIHPSCTFAPKPSESSRS